MWNEKSHVWVRILTLDFNLVQATQALLAPPHILFGAGNASSACSSAHVVRYAVPFCTATEAAQNGQFDSHLQSFSSPPPCSGHKKTDTLKSICFFMVQARGLCIFASQICRPRPSTGLRAMSLKTIPMVFLPLHACSGSRPLAYVKKRKKIGTRPIFFRWCRQEDSNLHEGTFTRTWTVRVCQFRHACMAPLKFQCFYIYFTRSLCVYYTRIRPFNNEYNIHFFI